MDDEKPGETRSVYFKREDLERYEAHAGRNGRSFSWAVRDLGRRGWAEARLEQMHRDGAKALR